MILPNLTLKLVAIATSLGLSKKGVRSVIYEQIPTYDENSVKIDLVDPEVALLKGSFRK